LAVQENCIAAVHLKEDEVIIGKLLDHYYDKWNRECINLLNYTELFLLIHTHTPAGKGHNNQG
jgi:hypothetical protein